MSTPCTACPCSSFVENPDLTVSFFFKEPTGKTRSNIHFFQQTCYCQHTLQQHARRVIFPPRGGRENCPGYATLDGHLVRCLSWVKNHLTS